LPIKYNGKSTKVITTSIPRSTKKELPIFFLSPAHGRVT